MPRYPSQFTPLGTPFALIGVSAIVLSILTVTPAAARQQSAGASESWCSLNENLTSTQRIDGCSAILARKTSITARVAAFVLRGKVYGERREYTNAIDDFSAALKLVGNNAMALRERGDAYFSIGDTQH